jgi:hypothetical protein
MTLAVPTLAVGAQHARLSWTDPQRDWPWRLGAVARRNQPRQSDGHTQRGVVGTAFLP